MVEKREKIKKIVKNSKVLEHEKQQFPSGSLNAKRVEDNLSFDDGVLKGHNQEPYKNLLKGLKTSGCALINHATGTGKSYLTAKYLKDGFCKNNKKVLYLVNSNSIIENFKATLVKVLGKDFEKELNITFATYQGAKNLEGKKFDLVVCDEAHHLGASKWQKDVFSLLSHNPDADLLGLSATIERMDKIDITKIFGKPVSNLSLLRAYKQKILTPPHYFMCEMNFQKYSSSENEIVKRIEELQNREASTESKKEKAQAQKLLKDYKKIQKLIPTDDRIGDVLTNIFKQIQEKDKDAKTFNGKIIVFCPAGKDEQTQQTIAKMIYKDSPNWFGQSVRIHPYYIHSTQDGSEEELENFRKDNTDCLRILFNVGMVGEGVHLDDIDGVIMLRPTESKPVYIQQLGRIHSASKNGKAWVVDCVSNALSMSKGDLFESINHFVKTVFGGPQDEDQNKDGKDERYDEIISFSMDPISRDIITLLSRTEKEFEELKTEFDTNHVKRLIEVLPVYAKAHPEMCDKNGKLIVGPRCRETFTYTNSGGEEIKDYKIGQDLQNVKSILKGKSNGGKISEVEKEKLLLLIELDLRTRGEKPNSQCLRLFEALPEYAKAHPEMCDKNGKLIVGPQAKETFTYKNTDGEEIKDYKIGQDLNDVKKILKGKGHGKITEAEKEKLFSLIELDLRTRGEKPNSQCLRLFEALPEYAKAHPEMCDENGKLIIEPQRMETFTYTNSSGEEIKDYKIKQDLQNIKSVLRGQCRGKITESEKEKLFSLIDLDLRTREEKQCRKTKQDDFEQ